MTDVPTPKEAAGIIAQFRDAQRYRWLREHWITFISEPSPHEYQYTVRFHGHAAVSKGSEPQFDYFIDKLMGFDVAPPVKQPTPKESNAAWFVALKGTVLGPYEVRRDTVDNLNMLVVNSFQSDFICVADSAFVGQHLYVARTPYTGRLDGVGKTPAEAIADFNRKMVGE